MTAADAYKLSGRRCVQTVRDGPRLPQALEHLRGLPRARPGTEQELGRGVPAKATGHSAQDGGGQGGHGGGTDIDKAINALMADFDAWCLCLGGIGGASTTDHPLAPVASTTAEDSAAVPDTATVALEAQSDAPPAVFSA